MVREEVENLNVLVQSQIKLQQKWILMLNGHVQRLHLIILQYGLKI